MSTSEPVKKTPPPKLVTTNKAFKLAELWVSNMSKPSDVDSIEEEMEGRPSRLGIGARVPRQYKMGPSNDPVERKLQAKLAQKKKDTRNKEETLPFTGDDEDDESESRTSAFAKRKAIPLISPLQSKKKLK